MNRLRKRGRNPSMHPQTPIGPTCLPSRAATPQHRTPYARRDPTDKPGKETKPHAPHRCPAYGDHRSALPGRQPAAAPVLPAVDPGGQRPAGYPAGPPSRASGDAGCPPGVPEHRHHQRQDRRHQPTRQRRRPPSLRVQESRQPPTPRTVALHPAHTPDNSRCQGVAPSRSNDPFSTPQSLEW